MRVSITLDSGFITNPDSELATVGKYTIKNNVNSLLSFEESKANISYRQFETEQLKIRKL